MGTIVSISKELKPISIPSFYGELKMVPFEMGDMKNIPMVFRRMVREMLEPLGTITGRCFLTVDGKQLAPNQTHRRPGRHIDGNYIEEICGWGSGGGGGDQGGWKVGEGGRALSSEHHKLSYQSQTGGMVIASTYPACMGWNGMFDGEPGIGGDCSHIEGLSDGFMLKPNTAYYGNSQFIHESIPVNESVHRVLARITLPLDTPVKFN